MRKRYVYQSTSEFRMNRDLEDRPVANNILALIRDEIREYRRSMSQSVTDQIDDSVPIRLPVEYSRALREHLRITDQLSWGAPEGQDAPRTIFGHPIIWDAVTFGVGHESESDTLIRMERRRRVIDGLGGPGPMELARIIAQSGRPPEITRAERRAGNVSSNAYGEESVIRPMPVPRMHREPLSMDLRDIMRVQPMYTPPDHAE